VKADAWIVRADDASSVAVRPGWSTASLGEGFLALQAPAASVADVRGWAAATAGVRYVEPDFVITTSATPNDPSDPVAVAAAKAAALGFSFEETGASGVSLSAGTPTLQTPENAKVVIDDNLTFERRSNSFSDVLPGVKFDLTSTTVPGGENLVINQDNAASKARIQKLVDAMNGVFSLIGRGSTEGVPPGRLVHAINQRLELTCVLHLPPNLAVSVKGICLNRADSFSWLICHTHSGR
jgi:hypothetical protein